MPKTTKKTTTKKPEKIAANAVTLPMVDVTGKELPAVSVERTQLLADSENKLVNQAVRVYQSMTHQGTHSTKTRGEVTGSTRKIYRQKGTGRARHGAITAPIFVGGGITFGPKPKNVKRTLPDKMKQKAFAAAISGRMLAGSVTVVSGLSQTSGKTRDMASLLQKVHQADQALLFILERSLQKAVQGTRNINHVTVRNVTDVSLMDVLAHNHIVIAQEAIETLLQRISKTAPKKV